MADEQTIEGASMFRLIQNGVYCAILIDCQTDEAAKVAYEQLLRACREEGGVTITIQGLPQEGGPNIFEKGVNYGEG